MNLVLVADGASSGNGRSCGAGVVLYDKNSGKLIHSFGEYIGEGDNTYAECQAVVKAITWMIGYVQDMEAALRAAGDRINLWILTDSNFLVDLMNDDAKPRTDHTKRYLAEIMSDLDELKAHKTIASITVKHVGRDYTHEADSLAQEAAQKAQKQKTEAEFPFLKK